jgi:1,5-anhydro-D-fructose reductase (1,5-anhydro-D-mannitol-forming)
MNRRKAIDRQPVSLGLVGAGGFGQKHLAAADREPTVAMTAILSRSAAEKPGRTIYRDLDRFLDHPGLEGVVLAVPNPLHPELTMAAFRAGKHVLVEKPLTNNVQDGVRLVREAAARGLLLAVGHNSRRTAHVRAMKRLLTEGALGQVTLAEGHFSHDGGLHLEPGLWRWAAEACPGGALNLLGIHEIDTLQYLLGPVVRVGAWQRRLATPAEIPDATMTWLEFESGAMGYVGSSYASAWHRAVRLFGTLGNARWDDGGELRLDTPDGQHRTLPLEPVDTLAEQLADFAAGIHGSKRAEVHGLAGLANVAVMEAALESNRQGTTVSVQEVYERAEAMDLLGPVMW